MGISRGSGGNGYRSRLEDDVGVDDCVGEGVEVGAGVEVALVGDLSSLVLEEREGTFGHGAGFVGVLEVR